MLNVTKAIIISMIFSFVCCSNATIRDKKNITIVAKYIVWDENKSVSNESFASLLIDDAEFDIIDQINLDSEGFFKEYILYTSKGVFSYDLNKKEIGEKNYDSFRKSLINVRISKDVGYIIDTEQRYKIEKIYEKEHFIFVKKSDELKKKKQRYIYEYS